MRLTTRLIWKATPENFGRLGSPPTHPELLDWLAVDFMAHGWRIKRLHKLIMTSTVYRQSSRRSPEDQSSAAESIDPANDLLWRMNLRRLEAEVIRDAVLDISGKLDGAMGGPPLPLDSTPEGLVTVSRKAPSPYRRSLYLLARRNYPVTFLDVFDFPIMSVNCPRRNNSATPLQSLTLLNDEFVMNQSEEFAARVCKLVGEAAPPKKKIEQAFLLALSREPSAEEVRLCLEHLEKQSRIYEDVKAPPGQAAQRALASLCQMLLATNEFLYID